MPQGHRQSILSQHLPFPERTVVAPSPRARRSVRIGGTVRLAAALAILIGWNAPASSAQEQLTIATFNAEWLFDGVGDGVRSPYRNRPGAATDHMEDVADVIRAINADVVNLVEVEDLTVLERLNSEFLTGMGYTAYLVNGRDTYTGQDVGLLSRITVETPLARTSDRVDYPIPESEIGSAGSGSTGVSKHYYAVLSSGNLRFTLLGIHFLAFPNHRQRAVRREGQAEVIRRLARSEGVDQNNEVIILGDFNDYEVLPDAAGSAPVSQVLAVLKDVVPANPGDELVNVASEFPVEDRYSAWYDEDGDQTFEIDRGEATLIDHILVSQALATRIDSVWFYRDYAAGTVSDHWPLVVRLTLADEVPTGEALYTGVVVSNPVGEVHPLDAPNEYYLMLPSGIYLVLTSAAGEPAQYLDLQDWLGRRVSVHGTLADDTITEARLAGSP